VSGFNGPYDVHDRVVMFSGGIGSYCAARRVVDRHGPSGVTLLFADVAMEDEDTYRFVPEAAARLGVELVTLRDGRTPWDVFNEVRFLGNSRVDPCSRALKREPMDAWVEANREPAETALVYGIGWDEEHRFRTLAARRAPWACEAPMCDPPFLSRNGMLDVLRADGLEPPRLYALGFPHNNCGGFCVKAGQESFRLLLATMPARYAEHEAREEAIRATLGADVAILTDRRGDNKKKPMTMRAFREAVERGDPTDLFDFGSCSCLVQVDGP
jgi:hypothetical protein